MWSLQLAKWATLRSLRENWSEELQGVKSQVAMEQQEAAELQQTVSELKAKLNGMGEKCQELEGKLLEHQQRP